LGKKQKVTYHDFIDHLNKIHPSDDIITKPTFSRLLHEGLREIVKVYRTKFLLKYLMNKELQQDIREECHPAELWNKFQDAVFWGNGG